MGVSVVGDQRWIAGAYARGVSSRLDPSWRVVASPSTPTRDRCVDIFERPDGSFGFEEFRRDVEDMGAWTPLAYYSVQVYPTFETALAAVRGHVTWLSDVLGQRDGGRG